jgi:hypothetical protein
MIPAIGFIAIDPGLFRDREEFTADVSRFCKRSAGDQAGRSGSTGPVAGDPQWNNAKKRM